MLRTFWSETQCEKQEVSALCSELGTISQERQEIQQRQRDKETDTETQSWEDREAERQKSGLYVRKANLSPSTVIEAYQLFRVAVANYMTWRTEIWGLAPEQRRVVLVLPPNILSWAAKRCRKDVGTWAHQVPKPPKRPAYFFCTFPSSSCLQRRGCSWAVLAKLFWWMRPSSPRRSGTAVGLGLSASFSGGLA